MFTFIKTIKFDRWLGLSGAMIMMSCGGLAYTYGVYSEYMKEKLQYTQEQIDDIGAAKDFGSVLGLLSGLLYNLYPPWATVGIGAGLHFIGYSMVWLVLLGKASTSFWLLCFYFALGHGGDTWIDTACIMTSLQNFEESRGTAVGILKAEVGLSGAIFVMIYEVFLEPNVDSFLLSLSLVPTIIFVLLAFFIRPFTSNVKDSDEDLQRLQMTYCGIILLGIYLFLAMTTKELLHIGKLLSITMAVLMIFMMLVMFAIPVISTHVGSTKSNIMHKPMVAEIDLVSLSSNKEHGETLDTLPLINKPEGQFSREEAHSLVDQSQRSSLENLKNLKEVIKIPGTVNMNLNDCLLGVDFWLATVILTIGAGTGLAIINNFAQIAKAAGSKGADLFIGFISISNCFGRLAAGYGSDHLLRHGYPRSICLVMAQVTMSICCLFIATGMTPFLYIGSSMTGFAYGAFWSLFPTVISEVFGLELFAPVYKIISIGPPIGSYLLSAKLVGFLYDQETIWYQKQFYGTQNFPVEANTCQGRRCFAPAMLALASVCAMGSIASIVFWIRTKSVYLK